MVVYVRTRARQGAQSVNQNAWKLVQFPNMVSKMVGVASFYPSKSFTQNRKFSRAAFQLLQHRGGSIDNWHEAICLRHTSLSQAALCSLENESRVWDNRPDSSGTSQNSVLLVLSPSRNGDPMVISCPGSGSGFPASILYRLFCRRETSKQSVYSSIFSSTLRGR